MMLSTYSAGRTEQSIDPHFRQASSSEDTTLGLGKYFIARAREKGTTERGMGRAEIRSWIHRSIGRNGFSNARIRDYLVGAIPRYVERARRRANGTSLLPSHAIPNFTVTGNGRDEITAEYFCPSPLSPRRTLL